MDPLTAAATWGAILIGIAVLVHTASRFGRVSAKEADLADDQWTR